VYESSLSWLNLDWMITAGYGRGQWGAWPELGVDAVRTISRLSESAAKAARTAATQLSCVIPANP
jgi:hypothetical protein